jgi:hypothetical protein
MTMPRFVSGVPAYRGLTSLPQLLLASVMGLGLSAGPGWAWLDTPPNPTAPVAASAVATPVVAAPRRTSTRIPLAENAVVNATRPLPPTVSTGISKTVKPTPPRVSKPAPPTEKFPDKMTEKPYTKPVIDRPLVSLTLPVTIDSYQSVVTVPTSVTSAEQVLGILSRTSTIPVHIEAIRRAANQLSVAEQAKLVDALAQRHRADRSLVMGYFDYGLVQWLVQQKQSSLFYLRKANDAMKNPFTALAYAKAQIDVDLALEHASEAMPTRRKLDVTYLLKDAVQFDVAKHQPGFWPSLVSLLEVLRPMDAYKDAVHNDYSMAYVPFGAREIAFKTEIPRLALPNDGTASGNAPSARRKARPKNYQGSAVAHARTKSPLLHGDSLLTLAANDPAEPAGTLDPLEPLPAEAPAKIAPSEANLMRVVEADFLKTGQPLKLKFYRTGNDRYHLLAMTAQGQLVADFMTPVAPYIFEDLDQDGIYELVVRAYEQTPLDPVRVYRYQGGHYQLDPHIASLFQ